MKKHKLTVNKSENKPAGGSPSQRRCKAGSNGASPGLYLLLMLCLTDRDDLAALMQALTL